MTSFLSILDNIWSVWSSSSTTYDGGKNRNMSFLSVSSGYETIEEEFEASLRKAFVVDKIETVVIVDRRRRFLIESIYFGAAMGWLEAELVEYDDQSSGYEASLTEAGKSYFGLSDNSNPKKRKIRR